MASCVIGLCRSSRYYACTLLLRPEPGMPPRLTRPAGLCHTVPMSADPESRLQSYGELAVKVGLNLQPGQRLLIIGPARQRRRLARSGAARPAYRRQRVSTRARAWSRRSGATRRCSCARFQHAPRDSFDEFSAWLPQALVRARRGRARRAVDLRERSRSAERPAARSRRRRAAGRLARASARSASSSPATRPTGRVVAAAGAGVGGARVSRPAAGAAGAAAVGRDRRAVPARSSRSDRRVGDAPRRRSRARARLPERQAVLRAASTRVPAPT